MVDKHYNPVIAARLRMLVDGHRWPDVVEYLASLSHSQFRTAGYLLGEEFMPGLSDDDYWTLAKVLTDWNNKAFLVTVLKHAPHAMGHTEQLFFENLQGKAEDVRKAVMNMLPRMTQPQDIATFLQWVGITEPHQRINALLQCPTTATSYLLIRSLHEVEDDHALLVRIAYFLMKRGDALSFNLSSLMKSIFALEELKGTFSLHLRPYELSRLTTDYEAFKQVIES